MAKHVIGSSVKVSTGVGTDSICRGGDGSRMYSWSCNISGNPSPVDN